MKMAKRPIKSKKIGFPQAQSRPIRGVTKRFTKPQLQDARQKLIQKKRKSVVDARDVLAKMAKFQDARDKINKIREKKIGAIPNKNNVKIIGNSILRKVDRNGKISLITSKSKTSSEMNLAIQKELGIIAPPPIRRAPLKPPPKIVQNVRLLDTFSQYDNVYKWAKPNLKSAAAASQMIGSLEKRGNKQIFDSWANYPISRSLRVPGSYIDLDAVEDEEMPLVVSPPIKQTISLQGSSRVSNVHSRLDIIKPTKTESHGIFSQNQPKTKVMVPAGHRIVVSNLQSTVTQDDVKELFEDIGQLLAARLVRPGIAEVIYKNLKDAQKAVDTYHNRQLDGQPMKCLLVNKRPINNPTAPAYSDTQGVSTNVKETINASNKLVPDLSTIHKVLFQRK